MLIKRSSYEVAFCPVLEFENKSSFKNKLFIFKTQETDTFNVHS